MANTDVFALAMLMVAGTLILSEYKVSAQCGADIRQLITECQRYVIGHRPKVPPSAECCEAMKNIDFPCICNFLLTPAVQKLINMDKVVYVGRTCGLTIQADTKCGNYTVPPGFTI